MCLLDQNNILFTTFEIGLTGKITVQHVPTISRLILLPWPILIECEENKGSKHL